MTDEASREAPETKEALAKRLVNEAKTELSQEAPERIFVWFNNGVPYPKLHHHGKPCIEYVRADLRSDLAAVVPDETLIEGAHGDDYPSILAMKYAVEMEIVGALGKVQTQTLGKIIQRAIDAALAKAEGQTP